MTDSQKTAGNSLPTTAAVCPGLGWRPGFLARALTLVEIMAVIAIISILATLVLMVSSKVLTTNSIRQTKQTFSMLQAAIDKFKAATGYYPICIPPQALASSSEWDDFVASGGAKEKWIDYFEDDGSGEPSWSVDASDPRLVPGTIQFVYFQLQARSESGTVIDQLSSSAINAKRQWLWYTDGTEPRDVNEEPKTLAYTALGQGKPMLQVQDPWHKPIRYFHGDILLNDWWTDNLGSGPWPTANELTEHLQGANWSYVLQSAGPDEEFQTADDIWSDEQ